MLTCLHNSIVMYTHILCNGSNIQYPIYMYIQLIQDYTQLISIGVLFLRITCFPVQCVVNAFISIKMLSNERLVVEEKWIFEKKKKKNRLQIVFWYVLHHWQFFFRLALPTGLLLLLPFSIITDTAGILNTRWNLKHLVWGRKKTVFSIYSRLGTKVSNPNSLPNGNGMYRNIVIPMATLNRLTHTSTICYKGWICSRFFLIFFSLCQSHLESEFRTYSVHIDYTEKVWKISANPTYMKPVDGNTSNSRTKMTWTFFKRFQSSSAKFKLSVVACPRSAISRFFSWCDWDCVQISLKVKTNTRRPLTGLHHRSYSHPFKHSSIHLRFAGCVQCRCVESHTWYWHCHTHTFTLQLNTRVDAPLSLRIKFWEEFHYSSS